MNIRYYNRHQLPPSEESKYNATYSATLDDLLGSSDIISISCPLNTETTNLISTKEFAAMKDGVFFVNTARGAIVDEDALVDALRSGKVARTGLDVFVNEPHVREELRRGELSEQKVILQPHMGGLTDVAFHKSEKECFENIRSLFKTGRPIAPVNEI
jgi:lactate dehydrogenase-like 2-hydroxyacid dehydrogenase